MDAFLVPQPTDSDADADSDATNPTGIDATEHATGFPVAATCLDLPSRLA